MQTLNPQEIGIPEQSVHRVSGRSQRSSLNYHAGRVAEDRVADHYRSMGYSLCAARWRGPSGEIDLIFQKAGLFAFVEVKASKTHEQAATALHSRQIRRIQLAACEYLSAEGHSPLTDMRLDAALVDRAGRIEILKNIFAD